MAKYQILNPVPILRKFAQILIFIMVISGCEESIENKLVNVPPIRMVVDAMVTNQPGESYVKLSLPMANPNDRVKMISGAVITISDGKNYTILAEILSEKGLYKPDAGLRGVTGKDYKILIQTSDFTDSAFSYLLPVSPLTQFKTIADESKPGNFFISGENGGDPAMIRYTIDQPGCTGDSDCRSVVYEYILSTFDVPQIFSPKKEVLSFPSRSRVIRKKYSLNTEYEAYTRAILSETEWRGGLFDVQAGNPKGNFGKNTFGFFAGCSLVVDTVFIQ